MYDYTLLNQQAVMYSNGEQINYTYKPDGLRHSVEMDGETKYQYWSGSQLAYEEQKLNKTQTEHWKTNAPFLVFVGCRLLL